VLLADRRSTLFRAHSEDPFTLPSLQGGKDGVARWLSNELERPVICWNTGKKGTTGLRGAIDKLMKFISVRSAASTDHPRDITGLSVHFSKELARSIV
jgi:hypothetical protein